VWTVLLVLSATAAWGQEPRPLVAPFPLDFKRVPGGFSKKDREELQKLLPLLVRGADAATPDPARLASSLAELKRQDCDREDECLAQLAKLSGSLYGLYVGLDYTLEKRVVAVGRVVRDDGVAMGPAKTVEVARQGAFKDIAREAVKQLLAQLGVGRLSPFRPASAVDAKTDAPKQAPDAKEQKEAKEADARPPEVTPDVTKPELPLPPPPPPAVVADDGAGQRLAGRSLLIGGAIVAVAGASVLLAGRGVGGSLQPDMNQNLPREQLSTYRTASTLTTVGVVGLAVGGASAVTGAILMLTARGAPQVTAGFAPMAGGAVLSIQGEF
jgi:hypothetical protein